MRLDAEGWHPRNQYLHSLERELVCSPRLEGVSVQWSCFVNFGLPRGYCPLYRKLVIMNIRKHYYARCGAVLGVRAILALSKLSYPPSNCSLASSVPPPSPLAFSP